MADCAAGVDVILAAGACHKLWLRCYFAGCRAVGVRDRHSLLSDAALPEFPFDFPDTQAGQQQSAQEGAECQSRFLRRPPAKRPNFELLGVHSPHTPDWSSGLS
ncbi:POP1 [Symbiodinium natans]|uniref:POP1 protein n=1 Tax=Symbiodinium natans TaxID=878477 RepID=A0A812TLI9_9DINO|nr:POP1 [Symbiodinium natans]